MTDVVALGELLIDFACLSTDTDGYPTMAAHPGGAPANFLAALTKYGCRTAMIGKVGDDAFGRLLTYLQLNPRRVAIRDTSARRSFAVANVPTVAEAHAILTTITSLPSA